MRGTAHIRAVEDYVDQAIFSVVASLRAQTSGSVELSVSEVAKILTSGRSNAESDLHIEAERRFAYSRQPCLEVRVNELLQSGFLQMEGYECLNISTSQLPEAGSNR